MHEDLERCTKTDSLIDVNDNSGDMFQQEMFPLDSGINDDEKPFDPSEIDIVPMPFSVFHAVERLRNDEIDLSPAFQRNQNLWRPWQQSQLIESLILGIPLPVFYFTAEKLVLDEAGVARQKLHVVDGLQRLCAIRNFIIGKNNDTLRKMRLSDLEYLRKLNGYAYDELAPALKRNILEAPLTAFMIRSTTPKEVKFNIFKRLNTGGIPLSQQEIRHAMHQGIPARFLEELSNTDEFKETTRNHVPSRRMLDREYVNRYLAFRMFGVSAYRDMDSFLDDALTALEKFNGDKLYEMKSIFVRSLSAIHKALGDIAYCQYDVSKGKWNYQINKALFEVLTVCTSRLTESALIEYSNNVNSRFAYEQLFADTSEMGLSSVVSTSTGRGSRVRRRYEIVVKYLYELTGERVSV